jgi:hypothetical protein
MLNFEPLLKFAPSPADGRLPTVVRPTGTVAEATPEIAKNVIARINE